MNRDKTYKTLVEGATQMMLYGGYHLTSIRMVMLTADLGKGSFKHYFKNKEDLAGAVLDHYNHKTLRWQLKTLNNPILAPMERIHNYFAGWCDYLKYMTGLKGGCLLGVLGQEITAKYPLLRLQLNDIVCNLRHNLAACLAEGQKNGQISNHLTAIDMAELILVAWEGTLWRMKITANDRPLKLFLECFLRDFKV